ncbi:hypothetical protein [Flavonifractor sp. An100]|uniref:hypothetical protein n=1 Tax=Flavonifractor sp. An100 TaxID=1965538 RepID=UPI000B377C2D|nr:hypothetical protein [Flavonifractor sp. An100]OUQ78205.1 hypothetical protein B5E43_09125 [Flavonifractor sp. An100]
MNLMFSTIGITLIFAIFIMLVPIALLVVVQVWLSKKGKWLGLILPVLSFLMSLLLVFGMTAFQLGGTGGSTLVVTDEHGQVIQEEHREEEHHISLTPGAVGAIAGVFFVSNIPTIVFGGIWLHYKNRRDFQDDLKKMKIEDLE